MASAVDICNLALANLGDVANLQSIDPPDGSAQADHCATFYPIARDALLEMHDWGFSTKRVALAQLVNPTTEWAYCYAQPNGLLNAIAVLDAAATDDVSVGIPTGQLWCSDTPIMNTGNYTPQPFVLESADDGTDVVYTNQPNAMMRCTVRVTDTSKFSPLFVRTLAASLAAMLAGPLVKGEPGVALAMRWETIAFGGPQERGRGGLFKRAAESDSNQRRTTARDRQAVSWINSR
jgi:hypothetical protein